MKIASLSTVAIALAGLCCGMTAPAAADPVEDFYKGKTITIIVPFNPGGTTALIAETIAAHMGKHIPGNPGFLLEYMPGAGGLIGQNYAYNQAPRDGTAIFLPQDSTVVLQYLSPDVVHYDARNFNWLGVLAQSRHVLVVRNEKDVDSIEDLKTQEVFIGSSGAGSETDMYPRITNSVLGTVMNIVPGYAGGAAEVMLAVESGEVDGSTSTWQSWLNKPDLFPQVTPVLVYGNGRIPDLPDVPNLLELVEDPEDQQIVRFISSIGPIGRGAATPPDVPADRLAALRQGFAAMLDDPEFLAGMQAINVSVDAEPLTGEQAQELVIQALDVPEAIIARTKELVNAEAQ